MPSPSTRSSSAQVSPGCTSCICCAGEVSGPAWSRPATEQTLRDAWAEGPNAYLGIGVAGFPNLFTITGQAHLRDEGIAAIEPTPEAQETWARHAEEVGNATLYPTADSWYMGANVPGKPRVFMPYIGGVGVYRQKCDEVAAKGYAGFSLSR